MKPRRQPGRSDARRRRRQTRRCTLTSCRGRGLFAGVALEGATLRQDLDDNAEMYGKRLENRAIVTKGVHVPSVALPFIELLNKYSPKEHTN